MSTPEFLQFVEWQPNTDAKRTDPDIPVATHSGVWEFNAEKLRVYRLDDGRTIIDAEDMVRVFGDLIGLHGEELE